MGHTPEVHRERTRFQQRQSLGKIRFWLTLFMLGLILSGITAFPLETELHWFVSLLQTWPIRRAAEATHLLQWITQVSEALLRTNARYPFLAYGTDWLAFAHLVLALAFVGPYRDPVRNKWVVIFGLIACSGVIPLAMIAGSFRHIPFAWRLIDCSFGIFGALPLLRFAQLISRMERSLEAEALDVPG